MKKNNVKLFEEMELQYNGEMEYENYDYLIEFLEFLYAEGIIDEIEKDAYENIKYNGKCTNEEFDYVLETMDLWNDKEYFRRLEEVNGF